MPRKATPKPEVPAEAKAPAKKAARPKAPAAAHKTAAKKTPARTEPAVPVIEFQIEAHRAEIERQAYFYWVERGYAPGNPSEDWVRAEAEIRQRYLRKTASTRP